MAKYASGTIDANDETVGPVDVAKGEICLLFVDYTAGTLTLQSTPDGGTTWLAVEDGYTADTAKHIVAPGRYRFVGSSTPDAECYLTVL